MLNTCNITNYICIKNGIHFYEKVTLNDNITDEDLRITVFTARPQQMRSNECAVTGALIGSSAQS